MKALVILVSLAIALTTTPAQAAADRGFQADVLVDGTRLGELSGRGSVYIEALRNRPYAIRLTNPLPIRVAVALSVDGRNTIDARRTSARGASKWVLGPYESTVVSGWQVDGDTARLFTFTTESRSYAAWLGDTANLGVIEAVFYREKAPIPISGACDLQAVPPAAAGASPVGAMRDEKSAAANAPRAESEMAATGMGSATSNPVTRVHLNLEESAAARVRIRYEYRDQLVALGLLPRLDRNLAHRERSTGFAWCPEP